MIAAIGAGATVLAGGVVEVARGFLGKAKDKEAKEEALSSGLRLDLARKEQENALLKKEVDSIESERDHWRQQYWILYEEYMSVRVVARTILIKAGWTEDQVDEILPEKQIMTGMDNGETNRKT